PFSNCIVPANLEPFSQKGARPPRAQRLATTPTDQSTAPEHNGHATAARRQAARHRAGRNVRARTRADFLARITGACQAKVLIDKAECARMVSWGDSRERASSNMPEKVTSYPI